MGKIVAAVGLDPQDAIVAGTAAEWAAATGASLLLTHVCREAPAPAWWPFSGNPVPAESIDAVREQVTALAGTLPASVDTGVDVRTGAVSAAVAAITREHRAGLLVVSRGAGGHRLGSVAYRIMREAEIPTLVVAAR